MRIILRIHPSDHVVVPAKTRIVQRSIDRQHVAKPARKISRASGQQNLAVVAGQLALEFDRIGLAWPSHRLSKLSKLSFRNFSLKVKKSNGINALVKIVKIVMIFSAQPVAWCVRAWCGGDTPIYNYFIS